MLQLRVQIQAHSAEHLEDLLFSCGAVSISFEDAADEPILEPSLGDHPLWSSLFIQAHFTNEESLQLATKALENEPDIGSQIVLEQINDQGWQESFQQKFTAMQFGPLWVYPSWEENPAPDGLSLQLDPGMAFGTGHHATTSLCLKWLGNFSLDNLSIIDFGCGSGILALAAIRMGAKHVYAIDIDPQAILATEDNIGRNHLAMDQFTLGNIHCLSGVKVDVIVANILAAPLLELRQTFEQHLNNNGRLVISGILATQIDQINEQYCQTFTCTDVSTSEEWACISYTKKA